LCDENLRDPYMLERAHSHSVLLGVECMVGCYERINTTPALYEKLVEERLHFLLCVRYDRVFVTHLQYVVNHNGRVNIIASPPLACDFGADRKTKQRLRGYFDRSSSLMKAIRVDSFVLDCTAGFGTDALIMAYRGCQVLMVEHNPVLYLLINDSLERCAAFPEVAEFTARMSVVHADSEQFLRTWKAPAGLPVSIYLDPFYPDLHGMNRARLKYARTNKDISFALRCTDWMDEKRAGTFTTAPLKAKQNADPLRPSTSKTRASLATRQSYTDGLPACFEPVFEMHPTVCSGLGCLLQAAYTQHDNANDLRVIIKRPTNAPILPRPKSWHTFSFESRGVRYDVQSPPAPPGCPHPMKAHIRHKRKMKKKKNKK